MTNTELADKIDALAEKATKGRWFHYNAVFRPQFSQRKITEIQQQKTGKAVINWMGFDGDQSRKANANAALIVELVNARETLTRAARNEARMREAAIALRDDMLMRAERNRWQNDGELVVEAGTGVWLRFNQALGDNT